MQVDEVADAAAGTNGDAGNAAGRGGGDSNVDQARAADGSGGQPAPPAPSADVPQDDGNGDDAWTDEREAEAATADELKGVWLAEQKLAVALAQQGYAADHAVRAAAEAQAAAAEEAWMAAKAPIAVSTRMQWAERALGRAKRAQAKMEQSISQLDDDYEVERAARVQQLGDLRAKTREKQEKLAALTQEAAGEYPTNVDRVDDGAVQGAKEVLECQLGPALQELWEQAPADSELRSKLAGVMEAATGVHGYVTYATRRGGEADWSDIGGGYDEDQYAGTHDGWRGWQGRRDYDDYRGGGQYCWWGDQRWEWNHGWHSNGQWHDGEEEPHDQPQDMDLRDVQVPRWMRGCGAAAGHDRDRAWKRGRLDGDGWGYQGRHVDAAENAGDQEAAARLQAQQHDAVLAAQAAAAEAGAAAGEATAVTPAPPTPNAEDHRLEKRREEVWHQAQVENVAVACSEIAAMSSDELEQWAKENLV